jgi:BirA family transcriptional regulator, biotin operon repressor / biotin---[acetyl-CoA-carboxylase] ligase
VLNEDVLLMALRDAEVPDAPVHYYEVVDSTNAAAMALAREDAPEWTIVAAGHQTAGRGRLGRTWTSEPGSSLLFSFVLRPRMEPERAPLLTLLAGAAMANACSENGRDVGCKWPNDLLLDNEKVGGILVEASVAAGALEFVVVGAGVNVGDPPAGVEGAAGLAGVGHADLLTSFLAEFWHDYHYRRRRDFASAILDRYRPLCVTLGRRVRARTTGGAWVEGVAEDLDATGNLLVHTETGLETVGFGEVEHLR